MDFGVGPPEAKTFDIRLTVQSAGRATSDAVGSSALVAHSPGKGTVANRKAIALSEDAELHASSNNASVTCPLEEFTFSFDARAEVQLTRKGDMRDCLRDALGGKLTIKRITYNADLDRITLLSRFRILEPGTANTMVGRPFEVVMILPRRHDVPQTTWTDDSPMSICKDEPPFAEMKQRPSLCGWPGLEARHPTLRAEYEAAQGGCAVAASDDCECVWIETGRQGACGAVDSALSECLRVCAGHADACYIVAAKPQTSTAPALPPGSPPPCDIDRYTAGSQCQ